MGFCRWLKVPAGGGVPSIIHFLLSGCDDRCSVQFVDINFYCLPHNKEEEEDTRGGVECGEADTGIVEIGKWIVRK